MAEGTKDRNLKVSLDVTGLSYAEAVALGERIYEAASGAAGGGEALREEDLLCAVCGGELSPGDPTDPAFYCKPCYSVARELQKRVEAVRDEAQQESDDHANYADDRENGSEVGRAIAAREADALQRFADKLTTALAEEEK